MVFGLVRALQMVRWVREDSGQRGGRGGEAGGGADQGGCAETGEEGGSEEDEQGRKEPGGQEKTIMKQYQTWPRAAGNAMEALGCEALGRRRGGVGSGDNNPATRQPIDPSTQE